jgi:6-phosphofructokinase
MRVGILTGGGDCPGLNAVIRAAVRKGIFHHNDEFVGFIEGWRGVVDNKTMLLTIDTVSGILQLGGTILRTSRTNPRKMEGGIDKCLASIKANRLDALITIGGDDTQGVANALVQKGIKVVGVPKTIDNDLSGTDACFGFDTAVSIATEAVDRLHSTAEAHNRVIVCEVMGRDAGWIAITSRSGMIVGNYFPSSWSPKAPSCPARISKLPKGQSWMPLDMPASAASVKPLPS